MRDDFAAALWCFNACAQLYDNDAISDYNAYISRLNHTDVQVRLGRYDSVDVRLDSCAAFFEENDLAACNYYLATLRARILLERDGRPREALQLLQASPYSPPSDYLCYLRQELLRTCYMAVGLSDSVVALDEAMLAYKDSLLSDLAAMRVTDVELRYKESAREAKFVARQHTMQLQIFIAVLVAMVLVLITYSVVAYYRQMRRKRDMELEHLRHGFLKEQVRNLRLRLSPHYLMNLAHLLDQQQQSTSADAVDRDSAIALTLRRCMELSGHLAATLADEIAFVQDYVRLMPQSLGLDLQWQIAPDVDVEQVRIPGMSIQLPLENAVKHAYPDTQPWPAKRVEVKVSRSMRRHHAGTEVIIEDYGIGLVPASGLDFSNGYTILTKTIAYLNQRNRVPIDWAVVDKKSQGLGRGLRVTFFIPDGYRFGE
jgi:hypothetical protein